MSKITDKQLQHSVKQLIKQRKNEWRKRFGADDKPFLGFRRETIQQHIADELGIEYTDSGFRGRLKRAVENGLFSRWRAFERTVFYFFEGKKA